MAISQLFPQQMCENCPCYVTAKTPKTLAMILSAFDYLGF